MEKVCTKILKRRDVRFESKKRKFQTLEENIRIYKLIILFISPVADSCRRSLEGNIVPALSSLEIRYWNRRTIRRNNKMDMQSSSSTVKFFISYPYFVILIYREIIVLSSFVPVLVTARYECRFRLRNLFARWKGKMRCKLLRPPLSFILIFFFYR